MAITERFSTRRLYYGTFNPGEAIHIKGEHMKSVRKALARYDIRPRKRFGQSFLEDQNMIRRIAALAEATETETVVEIGAGLGFLTTELARSAGKVIALEIDPRLVSALRDRFAGNARVEIVPGDVLAYDFSSASPGSKIKVIGNIPYHISTPILFRLFEFRRSISAMVLMFQKELADRIMASPGSKAYGIPSVLIARYAATAREMNVPPTCFYPEPGVVSSVLRIDDARRSGNARGRVALLDDGAGGLRPEKKNPLEQPPRCRFCRRQRLSGYSRRRASRVSEGRKP